MVGKVLCPRASRDRPPALGTGILRSTVEEGLEIGLAIRPRPGRVSRLKADAARSRSCSGFTAPLFCPREGIIEGSMGEGRVRKLQRQAMKRRFRTCAGRRIAPDLHR